MGTDQKIMACAKYHYSAVEEGPCRRMGNTDMYSCPDVVRQKSAEVCFEGDTYEAAQQTLNAKLLELSKGLQSFQEGSEPRTAKVCEPLAWEKTGRLVTTTDAKNRDETLPIIYREKQTICGEAPNAEEARKKWNEAAAAFVKGRPHYRYSNVGFQKIAEDAKKFFNGGDWKEHPVRGWGKIF